MGVDASLRRFAFTGLVADGRSLPRWAFLPLANYQLPPVDIAPAYGRTEVEIYVEDEWTDLFGVLTPRLGLRVDFTDLGETLWSPRLGVSAALWPGARLKAAFGLYHQRPSDPMALDAALGNPELLAEQACYFVAGVEQLLPMGVLVRAEGYYKSLRHLVVSPDTAAHMATKPLCGGGQSDQYDDSLCRYL